MSKPSLKKNSCEVIEPKAWSKDTFIIKHFSFDVKAILEEE